jgi:hypothetical protein
MGPCHVGIFSTFQFYNDKECMNKAKGNRGKNPQNKSNLVTPSSGAAIATHSTNPLEGNIGGGTSRIRID